MPLGSLTMSYRAAMVTLRPDSTVAASDPEGTPSCSPGSQDKAWLAYKLLGNNRSKSFLVRICHATALAKEEQATCGWRPRPASWRERRIASNGLSCLPPHQAVTCCSRLTAARTTSSLSNTRDSRLLT